MSDQLWAPSRVEFAEYVLGAGGGDDSLDESPAHARRAQAARQLWSGECLPAAVPTALACALCDEQLESFALGEAVPAGALCEECARLYCEAAAGPLLIDRLTIPAPRPDLWPLEPPGSRTVAFEPPLELRLTVEPGDGEGPYLVGYEDPDDPAALGVRDVNGEPGVSGGTRDDLVDCLAKHWGFHYLAYVSEAAGLARMGRLPIHPKDQEDAGERLAEFGRRVRVVSPPTAPATREDGLQTTGDAGQLSRSAGAGGELAGQSGAQAQPSLSRQPARPHWPQWTEWIRASRRLFGCGGARNGKE
jgi:hypothetical protein